MQISSVMNCILVREKVWEILLQLILIYNISIYSVEK